MGVRLSPVERWVSVFRLRLLSGEETMACCYEPLFERHSNPEIADIGQGGGAEYTVGACRNCGAVLIHCWAGGVAESIQVVTQDLVDYFLAADPPTRKKLLAEWFNDR